ncbi:MAG: ATP-binding cassette domain-containing protein [Anaerorhabdus sp.]|uniref:ABC transporter ATP-binding protein n=1 Tax=Anaerorhabdus sp. TaxID=1872524 RepID=UPI002FC5EC47
MIIFNADKIKVSKNTFLPKFSMIMQNFALVENMTVIQNIYLKKKDKNKANELLEKLQILHIKNQKIKNCSGGEKQRVAIARALMTDCKVLLADEPTGALDSESGSQIMEILRDLNSLGITILLVTHDLGFANQAKRTLELSDGRIIDDRLNQK